MYSSLYDTYYMFLAFPHMQTSFQHHKYFFPPPSKHLFSFFEQIFGRSFAIVSLSLSQTVSQCFKLSLSFSL